MNPLPPAISLEVPVGSVPSAFYEFGLMAQSTMKNAASLIVEVSKTTFAFLKESTANLIVVGTPFVKAASVFLMTRPGTALLATGASLIFTYCAHVTDNKLVKIILTAEAVLAAIGAGILLASSGLLPSSIIPLVV